MVAILPEIERQSRLRFITLNVLSIGFYQLAWLVKNLDQLNVVCSPTRIDLNIVFLVGALQTWAALFFFMAVASYQLSLFSLS